MAHVRRDEARAFFADDGVNHQLGALPRRERNTQLVELQLLVRFRIPAREFAARQRRENVQQFGNVLLVRAIAPPVGDDPAVARSLQNVLVQTVDPHHADLVYPVRVNSKKRRVHSRVPAPPELLRDPQHHEQGAEEPQEHEHGLEF